MAEPKEINVITTQLIDRRGAGEWERAVVERPVVVDNIKNGFEAFIDRIQDFLESAEKVKFKEFQLDEVSIMAEVGPEGDFKLIGNASANAQGGIRFTLRRRHTLETADLIRLFVGTQGAGKVSDNILRSSLSTKPEDTGDPVKLLHTNVVNTFETNVPLPVVVV